MIDVAIVEDEDDVREGLAMLINGSEGFRCIQRGQQMYPSARCWLRICNRLRRRMARIM